MEMLKIYSRSIGPGFNKIMDYLSNGKIICAFEYLVVDTA